MRLYINWQKLNNLKYNWRIIFQIRDVNNKKERNEKNAKKERNSRGRS